MPRVLHEKHKFLVDVPGLATAAFQKCSEVSVETAKIEYWEGATIIPFKTGGRQTVADVTLERGTSESTALYEWHLEVGDASIGVPGSTGFGEGLVLPDFKRDVSVRQLDRDNTDVREWLLHQAFPIKYVAGEWDNTADDVAIEMMTLTYDFPELVLA